MMAEIIEEKKTDVSKEVLKRVKTAHWNLTPAELIEQIRQHTGQ